MRRPRIPENENGSRVVVQANPVPRISDELTYLCVTGSAPQRRRRLVLIFLPLVLFPHLLVLPQIILILLILIPFDAVAVEKCHEG